MLHPQNYLPLDSFFKVVHGHWVTATSTEKIQATQPEGIYPTTKQAGPNPKHVEEI